MTPLAWAGLALYLTPVALMVAALGVYPLALWLAGRRRPRPILEDPEEWPEITISIPVYNEAGAIGATLDNVLAADYPPARRHVLVVSDASTDGTDAIVAGYAARGVRLVRLPARGGKTAAENEAGRHLRGAIVVNLDATIRIPPGALKALVRAFNDPSVGVASGRDVSVGDEHREHNRDESSYVGYEMWVRQLETRCGSIVGASGCFYAIRRGLFDSIFPEALSRDFASPLIAREHGFRSVSVDDAVCFVPRTRSLRAEYRRKVRTMTRGLETLWYKRHLLNPVRYGRFAWFLIGHKLARWSVFALLPAAAGGLVLLAVAGPAGRLVLAGHLAVLALGAAGYYWPEGRRAPRLLAVAGFAVSSHLAGLVAWGRALRGELNPVWEPTRRG
jgi:cellulose synthase/poly-beta-1,6-N-acetylglucosamine synthase-like glycosyltransferase